MLPLLALALALSADAFAAALTQGVAARGRSGATALRVGLAFGAAQGLMPLIGWSLGLAFAGALAAFDHWIAFAVLALLGGKLTFEGLRADPAATPDARPATGVALLALAIATSLDAAAAGFAFDAMGVSPVLACLVIAGVTTLVCFGGVHLGRVAVAALGGRAEVLGGVALIAVGVKILHDHGALG